MGGRAESVQPCLPLVPATHTSASSLRIAKPSRSHTGPDRALQIFGRHKMHSALSAYLKALLPRLPALNPEWGPFQLPTPATQCRPPSPSGNEGPSGGMLLFSRVTHLKTNMHARDAAHTHAQSTSLVHGPEASYPTRPMQTHLRTNVHVQYFSPSLHLMDPGDEGPKLRLERAELCRVDKEGVKTKERGGRGGRKNNHETGRVRDSLFQDTIRVIISSKQVCMNTTAPSYPSR